MRRAAALMIVLATAGSAMAKPGTPGPDYFTGTFERIGRSGGNRPALINDRVTIRPAGQSLAIQGCSGPQILLAFGPAFEIENLLSGAQADTAIECLFENNGYNYPILICRAEDGGAFTLWPLTEADLNCAS